MRTKNYARLSKIVRNFVCKFRNPLIISVYSGKTGIRTLGSRKGTTVFETAPIDHSGIFPFEVWFASVLF